MLSVAHELLKFGSYVVSIRRNCTVGQNFGVTSHSYLLEVLPWRVADLPRFQHLKRQSFPVVVDVGLTCIVRKCGKPFSQPRDAEHNNKES